MAFFRKQKKADGVDIFQIVCYKKKVILGLGTDGRVYYWAKTAGGQWFLNT